MMLFVFSKYDGLTTEKEELIYYYLLLFIIKKRYNYMFR